MSHRFAVVLALATALLTPVLPLAAQSFVLDLPRGSQHATVSQRVGITDIAINYHRPLVNGRAIWGKVVPYGQVWRAGANENTTISFSDPVTIEGKSLDRGTYGLHMLPNADSWTIIFSRNYTSWGSFTYDEKEDALRVTVKPETSDMHNALTYDFDNLGADSATVTLRWEKIAVPFKVAVNVNEIMQASFDKQLRGLAQYSWMGWDDAATYLHDNKGNLDQALKYANKSIEAEDRYDNEITKSRVLRDMGRKDEAKAAETRGLEKASPLQIHLFARQLQADNRQDEAFAIFRENAKKHPDQWFVHTGLARISSAQGDFDNATKEMKTALGMAPEQQKTYLSGLVKKLEDKQDVNK